MLKQREIERGTNGKLSVSWTEITMEGTERERERGGREGGAVCSTP